MKSSICCRVWQTVIANDVRKNVVFGSILIANDTTLKVESVLLLWKSWGLRGVGKVLVSTK
jgi:hypothetical protein